MRDNFYEAMQDTHGGGTKSTRCVGALFSDVLQMLSLTLVDSELQVPSGYQIFSIYKLDLLFD